MVVVPLGQSAVGCPVAAGIDSLTAKSGVSKALTRCHVANGSPVRSSGGAGSSARSAAIARPFSCPASPIPKSARSSPSSGQRPLVSSAAPRASFSAGLRHRRHVSSCPSACGANPAEAALSSLSLRRVLPSCSSSRRESYLPLGSTARWLRGDPDAAIFRSSAPPSTGLLTSNSAGGLLTARAEAAAGTLTTSGGQGAPAAAVEIAIPAPAWEGAKPLPFLLSVGVGLAVRFLAPRPLAVSPAAWQLLAIFSSTITGLVLGPLPVGAWAFLGLTTAVLTKTLSFSAAFSAFSSDVIWLIVISFFFARGFVKTGLGDRVATYFVKWMGKSTLGLSYGLTMAEALIAPAMPSTTARAGGVFVPIIKSLSLSAGSKPNDPSSKKVGAYLMQSQLQAAGNSSALYLTAAAQNLLCLKLASELGVSLPSAWMSWFKAASVPALTALLTVPYLIYKLFPPEDKETPEAPRIAAEKLRKLGPVTKNEWIMVATMLVAVTLWVLG
ncbi:hypothetical protein CBR_g23295 [Chara braunii]|uniref:Uncharacterized protein n=1 Tax=Chara braunii TaxID=69332 RepID=A0A388L3S7_CHABU|nr:hypothetical protein CBR_g23295 [Chara braunii]|eukprot:GBG76965.1 hypothetical protein CBR_g23295 [Chara braunii]